MSSAGHSGRQAREFLQQRKDDTLPPGATVRAVHIKKGDRVAPGETPIEIGQEKQTGMKIGEMAEHAGVPAEIIRHCGGIGRLPAAGQSGHERVGWNAERLPP